MELGKGGNWTISERGTAGKREWKVKDLRLRSCMCLLDLLSCGCNNMTRACLLFTFIVAKKLARGAGEQLDQKSAQSEIGVHTATLHEIELLYGPNSLFVLHSALDYLHLWSNTTINCMTNVCLTQAALACRRLTRDNSSRALNLSAHQSSINYAPLFLTVCL